nr:winged helix-turn-helix domain-containing protein [Actinomycetota bacterium]
ALVGDEEVWLSERERGVLSALSRRPGTVLSKAELLRRVWRSEGVDGVDGHAVEVAVSRLRRRLGAAGAALATVPRRGYRLDASASR